jgi:hypothetical protein
MTWHQLRWYLLTAGIVLGAWTLVYFAVITYAPLAYDPAIETKAQMDFATAVILFVPTVVYVVAALVLLRFWLAGPGARLSKMDSPERLLAIAAATLPDHRREWGAAMLGELADVQGRPARWRFALSCARAALCPRPGSWPVLALVAGAAVAATWLAAPTVGTAVPGLGVFAVSFVAMIGTLALLAVLRPRHPRFAVPAPAILVIGAVVAAIAMTAIFLHREPGSAVFLSPADAVHLAAIMAGSLWVAVLSPRALGASQLAPRLGAGAALVAVTGQLLLGGISRNLLPGSETIGAFSSCSRQPWSSSYPRSGRRWPTGPCVRV